MKNRKEYIDILKMHTRELKETFGIRTLCLFGSVSREEQNESSDVDICVEMPPAILLMVRLRRFLENLLGVPVDVVRKHPHMNPYLLKQIEHDGIYIFS